MKILLAYLTGYSLSRARGPVTPEVLPRLPCEGGKATIGELAAFAIGVGDGPVKETPDTLATLLGRVCAVIEPDTAKLAELRSAEERIKGSSVAGDAASKK